MGGLLSAAGLNAMQNLAALAAAAGGSTPTGSSSLTTSSSPLSIFTSSGMPSGQPAQSAWDAYKGWSCFLISSCTKLCFLVVCEIELLFVRFLVNNKCYKFHTLALVNALGIMN